MDFETIFYVHTLRVHICRHSRREQMWASSFDNVALNYKHFANQFQDLYKTIPSDYGMTRSFQHNAAPDNFPVPMGKFIWQQ